MQIFSKQTKDLLQELKKNSETYWNIPEEVAQMLYYLVRFGGAQKVLEIGTSNGYSGIWLGEALKINQGKLITIESHQERFNLASQNFKTANLSEVIVQVKGHAPEIFSEIALIMEGNFDLIFMDATKKQHLDFIKESFDLLKVGGLIVVDNILSHWEEMEKLVDFMKLSPAFTSEVVKIGDGVLLAYKLGGRL